MVGALAFARAEIQFGLQIALEYDSSDPELAYELVLLTISPLFPGQAGMRPELRSRPRIMPLVLMQPG